MYTYLNLIYSKNQNNYLLNNKINTLKFNKKPFNLIF